jgi:phage tail-like protein
VWLADKPVMPPQDRSRRFLLEIDRTKAGSFESIDNLSAVLEVLEYRDGGDPTPRKQPGGARYGDVTLKRGALEGRALWDWWRATRDGKLQRRTVTVILTDENGKAVARWQLSGCWPSRWRFGGGQADPTGFTMVEEITLVVERLEWPS